MSAHPFLQGRQIVLLSSVDWSAAWQRHHAWAEQFAAAGAEVFFVENTGFRGLRWKDAGRVFSRLGRLFAPPAPARLRVVAPGVLPPTAPAFRALNAAFLVPALVRKLRGLGLRLGPTVVAYLPTATTLSILDALSPSAVVYDCAAFFHAHPNPPYDLELTETALLKRSDLVLTDAHTLFGIYRGRHPHVLEVHHGVSEEFFLPPPKPGGPYKKLCYFGTVWSALDFAALEALAGAGFEVTLLGPVKEAPRLPGSIRVLPAVSHEELPRALSGCDALLLPYAMTPFSQGVIPAKTYECLATGRPVIAAPLPALKPLGGLLYWASSPAEYADVARKLGETESSERVAARLQAARGCSTSAQFAKIAAALEAALYGRHEN
ncbi:MAG TPA: hypothetical protein DCM05_02755 [Elusimicrobia bacterium]|nr:hypothetical protein [Elusimicrobiota bacterium]